VGEPPVGPNEMRGAALVDLTHLSIDTSAVRTQEIMWAYTEGRWIDDGTMLEVETDKGRQDTEFEVQIDLKMKNVYRLMDHSFQVF
jgi:hypothetical protein